MPALMPTLVTLPLMTTDINTPPFLQAIIDDSIASPRIIKQKSDSLLQAQLPSRQPGWSVSQPIWKSKSNKFFLLTEKRATSPSLLTDTTISIDELARKAHRGYWRGGGRCRASIGGSARHPSPPKETTAIRSIGKRDSVDRVNRL